jgi:hypothetical protein
LTDHRDPPDEPWEPLDPFDELIDLTGEEPLRPLEDPAIPAATPPRSPLLTGLIVALLLVVVSIAFFQFLRQDPAENGAGGTTIPATTSAVTTVPGTGTTEPGTTEPPTTTLASVPGDFDPYEAEGDPIDLADLTLAVDGVGPIDFGRPARQAVGRLVASLGEPEADTGPVVSTGAYGTCPGEMERIVRWGVFAAIVVVDPNGDETFAGYRLDLNYVENLDEVPTVEMNTLSGLRLGESVFNLEQVYSAFDLSYEVVEGFGMTFQLRSANTSNLLLWGPVTSDQSEGTVLGIYAPDACGRFQ